MLLIPFPCSPSHSHAEPEIEHNREYPEQGTALDNVAQTQPFPNLMYKQFPYSSQLDT